MGPWSLAELDAVIIGVDVSHWQGEVDWLSLKQRGVQFAYIKATDGLSRVDPLFHTNWQRAGQMGILRGAYHFFRSNSDPYAQVNVFLKTVEAELGQPPELPYALDFEVLSDAVERNTQLDYALQWLVVVEKMTSVAPLFYTNLDFMQKLNNPVQFERFRLWLAEYRTKPATIPPPWSNYTIWQFADRMQSNKLDTDRFDGTIEELKALITSS